MNLLNRMINQAKEKKQTIVLPEGKDQRVIDAALELQTKNIVNVVVLVNEIDDNSEVKKLRNEGVEVI